MIAIVVTYNTKWPSLHQHPPNISDVIFLSEIYPVWDITQEFASPLRMSSPPHLAFKFSQSQQIWVQAYIILSTHLRHPRCWHVNNSPIWEDLLRYQTDYLRKYGMCIGKNLWNCKMQLLPSWTNAIVWKFITQRFRGGVGCYSTSWQWKIHGLKCGGVWVSSYDHMIIISPCDWHII